jgi:hypothetical protein
VNEPIFTAELLRSVYVSFSAVGGFTASVNNNSNTIATSEKIIFAYLCCIHNQYIDYLFRGYTLFLQV